MQSVLMAPHVLFDGVRTPHAWLPCP